MDIQKRYLARRGNSRIMLCATAALIAVLLAAIFAVAGGGEISELPVRKSSVIRSIDHYDGLSKRAATEADVAAPVVATIRLDVPVTLPGSESDEVAQVVAYYELTDDERSIVERVVMAEAGGEDIEGQRLVAQCILNAAEMYDIRPDEVVLKKVQYTTPANEDRVTDSVRQAVREVFDEGYRSTDKKIWLFYAPAIAYSALHEENFEFVLEHGGHRFFA